MNRLKERQSSTVDLLERMEKKYRSIPFESILKQDVLRQGINFSPDSLSLSDYKPKDYFIFSFDHIPLSEMKKGEDTKAPEEIRVSGGHFNLLPTVISTRNNPESSYIVKLIDGNPCLTLQDVNLGKLEFPPKPAWYRHRTKSGKLPGEIAPVIEWGYLIYLTVFRNCQYFGKE
ncbi:MAG TPA: radical SAM protein, partial [Leptospiraceae bacterium]|nr:radical SAM protein [Leptospiraceae bacterium]